MKDEVIKVFCYLVLILLLLVAFYVELSFVDVSRKLNESEEKIGNIRASVNDIDREYDEIMERVNGVGDGDGER